MVKLDDYLDPSEQVIWRGKPEKKAFMLWVIGGISFSLFLLIITLIFGNFGSAIYLIFRDPFFENSYLIYIILISISIFIGGLIVFPIMIQLRKIPNAEYMLTNQRLLIKDGRTKDDVSFVKFEKIKDVNVKKSDIDKILGTGNISLITDSSPQHHRLRIMKEPYKIQKILKDEIFDYVNCEYCRFRYDLNKEEKCPKCERTHHKNN